MHKYILTIQVPFGTVKLLVTAKTMTEAHQTAKEIKNCTDADILSIVKVK